jgi:hypothetical protein
LHFIVRNATFVVTKRLIDISLPLVETWATLLYCISNTLKSARFEAGPIILVQECIMFTKISSKTGLVLAAFALPAAGMTVIATPAAAQSETMSAQQRAEALVAALNGSGGERSRWARDNFLSDGSYRMRVQQFNQLARRTGELTLLSVAEGDNGMVVQVRDEDGRTKAISVVMDTRRPDRILGIGMRGL